MKTEGWDNEQGTVPNVRAEAAWERLRTRMSSTIGFWLGFVFAPAPAELRALRDRVARQHAIENRRLVVVAPSTAEELGELHVRVLEDRTLTESDLIWIEALHVEAPGAPNAPWTSAWEAFLRGLEDEQTEVRRTLCGGLLLAAPPAMLDRVPVIAPALWEARRLAMQIDPQSMRQSTASAPPPVPRGSRPVMTAVRPEDPDELVTMSMDTQRLSIWAAERRSSVPSRVSELPVVDGMSSAEIARAGARIDAAEGFMRQGRLQDAKEAAEEACATLRGRGDPMEETRALATLAEIMAELGDAERAEVHVQKAIVRRGMAGGEVPAEWYGLAARLLRERSAFAAAAGLEERAFAALQARQGGDEGAEALGEQAQVLERLGEARLLASDAPGAATAFEQCLLLRRRLQADAGDDLDTLAVVSYALKRLGEANLSAGNWVAAVSAYREAVEIDRRLLAQARGDAELRCQLADSLWRLGDVLAVNGETEEAEKISEEAALVLAGAA
jgi:tetratricopeptide (TPR) repeat protein